MAKPSKKDLWLKHYLDEKNTATFLNATESAKAAKYKAKSNSSFGVIGFENLRKHNTKINQWLDDFGLSDERLKIKLLSLMEAKETKFFQKDGKVTDERDVEAIETQRRTLDMCIKVKGMYAAEKKELGIAPEGTLASLLKSIKQPDGLPNQTQEKITD